MKQGEKGFTLVELLIAITIMSVASGAAGGAIFQVVRGMEHNNDHMAAVSQVQNAGYWISRDTQMAQTVTTDDLAQLDFLILTWTVWDDDCNPTYHTVRYFFEDLTNGTNGIGKLKREHWSSDEVSEETLVARYVYYDPTDVDDTSKASYLSPVLTVQLTALFEETLETREHQITHRPNL